MRRLLALVLLLGWSVSGCSADGNQGAGSEEATTTDADAGAEPSSASQCLDAGEDGFIAFSASAEFGQEGTFDLWAVLPDGESLTQLTDTPGVDERYPQVSPDGGQVAYTAQGERSLDVEILDCEAGTTAPVTADELEGAQGASWSPDGEQLALYGLVDGVERLCVVDPDGGAVELVDVDGTVAYSIPAWSPDGEQIAVTIRSGEGVDIVVVSPDGSSRATVTDAAEAEGEPAWSPDGSQLAYFSDADGGNVWVVGADGSDPTAVTADDFMGSYQPAWAPDGERIVHVRNGPDESDLVIVSIDGGRAVDLVADGNINEAPHWWWPPA